MAKRKRLGGPLQDYLATSRTAARAGLLSTDCPGRGRNLCQRGL